MVLKLDSEAEALAQELVALTGESLDDAVRHALRERLRRERGRCHEPGLAAELAEIRRRCAALPVLDRRSGDEVVDYDERGLPR